MIDFLLSSSWVVNGHAFTNWAQYHWISLCLQVLYPKHKAIIKNLNKDLWKVFILKWIWI